jgi:hypothetical protein
MRSGQVTIQCDFGWVGGYDGAGAGDRGRGTCRGCCGQDGANADARSRVAAIATRRDVAREGRGYVKADLAMKES